MADEAVARRCALINPTQEQDRRRPNGQSGGGLPRGPIVVGEIEPVGGSGRQWLPLAFGLDRLAHRLVAARMAVRLQSGAERPDWLEWATAQISGAMDQAVQGTWSAPLATKGRERCRS
jgi:hypothetical protein